MSAGGQMFHMKTPNTPENQFLPVAPPLPPTPTPGLSSATILCLIFQVLILLFKHLYMYEHERDREKSIIESVSPSMCRKRKWNKTIYTAWELTFPTRY